MRFLSSRKNRHDAGPGIRFGLRIALAVSLMAGVSACSSKDEDTYVARDVEVLYTVAFERLERRQFKLAAALFDEVERQHPYSVWARRAQLMSSYAYYQANDYEDAILAAERFLALHPGNSAAPYAYYLIAICHYEQITDVGRDQKTTEQALGALREVVRRFPETEYARDAQLKIDLTRDHLAGKEMEVGRFYQNQNQFLSGLGRYRKVVEQFETTSHVPEALHRLVEIYLSLGITEEAQAAAAVLGYNFPDSKWYRYSYKLLTDLNLEPVLTEDSWLDKVLPKA